MKEENKAPVIRNYKDKLFRMIFSDKSNLLSLYNLISGKDYTDPDLLEIVTLENAIYMNMKNDLAFLIDCRICMYEHQSTYSPNLPLRHLFYVSREFEKITNLSTLYSSKRVLIPSPYFVVFYNGPEKDWTMRTSKLSESFVPVQNSPNLELVVTEININLGVNDNYFKQCKPLFEYMQYVDRVRTYASTMATETAVERAVNECINEGILSEFLLKNKSEAIQMSIFEYDEEKELKLIRQDEREIGREEGREIGLKEGREVGLKEGREDERVKIARLLIKYDLSQHIAQEVIIQRIHTVLNIKPEDIQALIAEILENT